MKKTKPIITLCLLAISCMLFAQDKCVEGDCKNGYGMYQWEDGSKYEGNFLNGDFEGEGTYYWANGNQHTGLWNVGRRHGEGKHTTADGIVTTGVWNYGYIIKTSQSIEGTKSRDAKEKVDMVSDADVLKEEKLSIKQSETFTTVINMGDVLLGPELVITDPAPTDDSIATDSGRFTIKGYATDPAQVLSLWVNDSKVKLENAGENHTEFEVKIKLENDTDKIVIEAINSKFDKSRKIYDVIFESDKKN